MRTVNTKLAVWLGGVALITISIALLLWWSPAIASGAEEAAKQVPPGVLQWGFMAAALATGLSALGAAYAVGNVGSAAIGALTEKPEMLGRMLIFIGLAEGIAIYGLIVSILILNTIL